MTVVLQSWTETKSPTAGETSRLRIGQEKNVQSKREPEGDRGRGKSSRVDPDSEGTKRCWTEVQVTAKRRSESFRCPQQSLSSAPPQPQLGEVSFCKTAGAVEIKSNARPVGILKIKAPKGSPEELNGNQLDLVTCLRRFNSSQDRKIFPRDKAIKPSKVLVTPRCRALRWSRRQEGDVCFRAQPSLDCILFF